MTPAAGRGAPSAQSRRRRLTAALGAAGQPRVVLALIVAVLTGAVVAVVHGLWQTVPFSIVGALPPAARFGLAAALAAVAQLARLRARLGRAMVSISWAEAAFILGFCLAPAGWLPAATLVGAGIAWMFIATLTAERPPVEVVYGAASLTLGVTAASAVTRSLSGSVGALLPTSTPGALTPRILLALAAGSAAYVLVTVTLTVLTVSLRGDLSARAAAVRLAYGKAPLLVGNVIVGLGAAFVIHRDVRWLAAFPPVLWLLQRTYRYHLRAEDERRIWQAFARATRTLGGLDERDVAAAGVRGALDVFGAQRVEVHVAQPDGGHRRYAAEGSGAVVEVGPSIPAQRLPGSVVARSMAVGPVTVGELTMWLPPYTTSGPPEELAVSAYGDALGGALHDAATHRRFTALTARRSHDALHDPLTGLVNRAALLARGDALLRGLGRDHPVAMLLLDVNAFKQVNATLGHSGGDELLKVVGARLTELVGDGELLARLGDDEFALLLTRVPVLGDPTQPTNETAGPLPYAVRRARRLVEQLAVPTDIAGIPVVTEVAVGVVTAKAACCDVAELIRRAEIAMVQAKRLRLGVATYDSSRDAASTDHLALLAELREALDADDQLILALQPAVDLATGVATGVEALTRWRHPRRGLLTPAEFISAVERSDLLAAFTRYVLDRALAAAADWAGAGLDVPVSVNVSARSLLDPGLPGEVADALQRHRLPAHQLVLEITETVAVSDHEIVDEVLAQLRQIGVQLSLDDFGTGYSSLAFLTRVRLDELKVDRSFVAQMVDSPEAATIVRSAVGLGRGLHLRVVAEGVETADQRTALLALGCAVAQGYHFCKPMPPDRIVTALQSLNAGARILPLRADDAS